GPQRRRLGEDGGVGEEDDGARTPGEPAPQPPFACRQPGGRVAGEDEAGPLPAVAEAVQGAAHGGAAGGLADGPLEVGDRQGDGPPGPAGRAPGGSRGGRRTPAPGSGDGPARPRSG